jgi:hypothetical protein
MKIGIMLEMNIDMCIIEVKIAVLSAWKNFSCSLTVKLFYHAEPSATTVSYSFPPLQLSVHVSTIGSSKCFACGKSHRRALERPRAKVQRTLLQRTFTRLVALSVSSIGWLVAIL